MADEILREIPGDLDATILINTEPDLLARAGGLSEENRDLMTKVLDPEQPNDQLSFHERKIARSLEWLP